MLKLLIATVPIALVLLLSEYLWRKKVVKGERARKFIHILAGVWMAFWPLYLPFDGIFMLGFLALTVLVYSRFTKLFHAIYAVNRRTYGEIFFALAIIVCAYLGREPWIFTVSILFLALADGGAAAIGRYWGSSNQYYVFGSKHLRKSIIGTVSFLIFAYISVLIGWIDGGEEVMRENMTATLLVLPVGAMILENITPYGSDNLITPVFATLLLNSLL